MDGQEELDGEILEPTEAFKESVLNGRATGGWCWLFLDIKCEIAKPYLLL